jgi:ribosomal RNA-processing protein 7
MEVLKDQASSFLKRFEENEEMESLKRSRESNMDEDGFIQVRYGKKSKVSNPDINQRSSNKLRRRNNNKKLVELTNFYRFQMRENRQNKLMDLRKKFEQDREKVALLKAQRKFKPF